MSRRPTGFSLVEMVFASVIVGGLFAAALATVGASRTAGFKQVESERGRVYALGLLERMMLADYEDPQDGSGALGLESGESLAVLGDADDLDDFDGWSGSPQDDLGRALAGAEGLTLRVTVEWVTLDNPTEASSSETGLKRVTVTASVDQRVISTVSALRARDWQDGADRTGVLR